MSEQLIASISVENLFGLYTYRLPETASLPDAAIFYGDNGVGKTTVLRLVFHLLSSADNRRHRNSLFESEFKSLEVELTSGIVLRAVREDKESVSSGNKDSVEMLKFSISKREEDLAIWDYSPDRHRQDEVSSEHLSDWARSGTFRLVDGVIRWGSRDPSPEDDKPKVPRGEKAYLSELAKHAPAMFIVNADRRLDSDLIPDPSDEMELRRVMRYEEPKRINDLVVRSREIALSQALSTASRWIGNKAIEGANQGSMNVHTVYGNVLDHLVRPVGPQIVTKTLDVSGLVKRLDVIEDKTQEFARYELSTPLSMTEFKKALSSRTRKNKELSVRLLEPYIRSLESRLDALEPIYSIVDQFIDKVNNLLRDKSISFSLTRGFTIKNRLGTILEPSQLSSGEQQLLLLFCYVLTARDQPSIFMIDEPEISLNVKWQRQLIQYLLDITKQANIQFIFASHSMELLSQHRSRNLYPCFGPRTELVTRLSCAGLPAS